MAYAQQVKVQQEQHQQRIEAVELLIRGYSATDWDQERRYEAENKETNGRQNTRREEKADVNQT